MHVRLQVITVAPRWILLRRVVITLNAELSACNIDLCISLNISHLLANSTDFVALPRIWFVQHKDCGLQSPDTSKAVCWQTRLHRVNICTKIISKHLTRKEISRALYLSRCIHDFQISAHYQTLQINIHCWNTLPGLYLFPKYPLWKPAVLQLPYAVFHLRLCTDRSIARNMWKQVAIQIQNKQEQHTPAAKVIAFSPSPF